MSAVALLVAAALAGAPLFYEERAPVMGTELELRLVLADESRRPAAEQAARDVRQEFERLETLLSEWRADSPFARLNANPVAGVVLPEEAFALLRRALAWSERSGGAFDPTFASLWGLWRFDPGDAARIPTPEAALARAHLIDYRKVQLDAATRRVRLGEGMKLGLGGIAKGYAVERVVGMLRARGFVDFYVKAGGELYLAGTRGDRPWIAGVQDPRDRSRSFAELALENSAFTTSGDYEHFLLKDGVRYHHIIDPATGYPARRCRAVTIVAERSEDADALSTAVFVMGPDRGLALVESLPGVGALIVTHDGEVLVSKRLRGKLRLEPLTPYAGP